jgi:hypothetical protein
VVLALSNSHMSQPDETLDHDLDAQLRGLFEQAEQALGERSAVSRRPSPEKSAAFLEDERALRSYAALPQVLKPLVEGIEGVTRALAENKVILAKLEKTEPPAGEGSATAASPAPQLVSQLQALLEQKNGVTQKMFDALHEELRA